MKLFYWFVAVVGLVVWIMLAALVLSLPGCATLGVKPTGDNLCTEQCRRDYPTPDGFELVGVAGPNNGKEMTCKCYKRPVSEREHSPRF